MSDPEQSIYDLISDSTLNEGSTFNRLGILQTLSETISRHLDLDELLDAVIEVIFSELKANNGSLLLKCEGEDYLQMRAARGLSPEFLTAKLKIGEGIAGKVAQSGNPLLLQGVCRESTKNETNRPHSSICVPIQFQGKIYGVICANLMNSKRSFSYKDLQMLQIMATQTAIAIQNISLMEGLKANNYAIVRSLAQAVEAKDPYTRGHCDFVSSYAVYIAEKMSIPPREIEEIKIGAILHDVGKIGISEAILGKAGRLTAEEYEIMKQHPVQSARIVEPLNLPQNCLHVIKYHHERLDGKGYPYGLNDREIYLGAKIVAVADTFDAITSNRPYRPGKPIEVAVSELQDGKGTQFETTVVEAFLAILPDLIVQGKLREHLCDPKIAQSLRAV